MNKIFLIFTYLILSDKVFTLDNINPMDLLNLWVPVLNPLLIYGNKMLPKNKVNID